MKRRIVPPAKRENKLQSIIDYLVDTGMTDFQVNMFIHTNLPALGEFGTIAECARDGKWDDAWRVTELYMSGDLD